jgi:hypothetical protein
MRILRTAEPCTDEERCKSVADMKNQGVRRKRGEERAGIPDKVVGIAYSVGYSVSGSGAITRTQ